MNNTFTRNEYMRIIEAEKELLGSAANDAKIQSNPSISTVYNIMDFSKAHSCRSSDTIGNIEHILN
ncbi:MAG: hypothetical protein JKY52_07750 [Flavobacteriales bacterium]|nr:hypothetical protein [Flavobacteriales bacterium]